MPGFLFNFGDKTSTESGVSGVFIVVSPTILRMPQLCTWRRLRGQLPKSIMQLGVLVQGRSCQSQASFWSHEITTQGIPEWIWLSKYLDTDQTLKSVSFTRNNEGPKVTSATISRCRREWVAWGLSGRGAIAWLGLRVAAQNLNMSKQRQQSHRLFQTHREDLQVLGELL